MKQRITIRDVAKYSGVSSATVSYVLNGVDKVSTETKERVLDAIKKLNYQPDFTAISLSKKKSSILGVMIPLIGGSLSPLFKEDHYYTEFISGFEHVCRENGYDLLISGIENPEDCKNWVKKRNLDGLVFLGLFPKSLYEEMKTLQIPIVLIDIYGEYEKHFNSIKIADELGGYLATKHLTELGHRQIAFVGPPQKQSPVVSERYQGYKKALKEANIPLDKCSTFECDGNMESGYQIGEKILQSGKVFTGIVSNSDILAVGIISALQKNGIKVPENVSIVGFDDLAFSKYVSPALTTINQDILQKGEIAGQILIDAIENSSAKMEHVTMPVKLVRRDSTETLRK
ncbi:LacI family DNA-binding transcriptional regulator [Bacillaceae bacterium Marseille-Q3522]|nr:LacI family DNA-binding transcriptional regulator [Bacillaceae bacterium Marseille-Q3522]